MPNLVENHVMRMLILMCPKAINVTTCLEGDISEW